MERNLRTRLGTAAILLLVFASGSVVGMAYEGRVDAAPAAANVSAGEGEDGKDEDEEGREERRRMIDRIELSAEQRAAVDEIVLRHRSRMDSLNAEFRSVYYPRYFEIVDSTRGRILDELTPEQAATYQSLLDDWDSRNPRDKREELPFRRRN